MATIHAIYASTSGNVELVVDTISAGWQQAGQQVISSRAEATSPEVLTHNSLFLFATSTWDHGIMNPFFNTLYEQMSTIDCSNKAAFFVGCGDFRYEPVLFNTGIQLILERWKERGGQELYHPLKLNGDPTKSLDNLIRPWVQATAQLLQQRGG